MPARKFCRMSRKANPIATLASPSVSMSVPTLNEGTTMVTSSALQMLLPFERDGQGLAAHCRGVEHGLVAQLLDEIDPEVGELDARCVRKAHVLRADAEHDLVAALEARHLLAQMEPSGD